MPTTDQFFDFNEARVDDLTAESPSAGANCRFKGRCSIGAFSYVGSGSEVTSASIGRYCSIAGGVIIGPTSHPTDRFTSHLIAFGSKGPFATSSEFAAVNKGAAFLPNRERTVIGNDVWIGSGALIRKGVTVGNGAVIGAGAVITRDVDPYTVVGGVPSRVIRERFPPKIARRLAATCWWEFSLDHPALASAAYSDVTAFLDAFEEISRQGALDRLSPQKMRMSRTAPSAPQTAVPSE